MGQYCLKVAFKFWFSFFKLYFSFLWIVFVFLGVITKYRLGVQQFWKLNVWVWNTSMIGFGRNPPGFLLCFHIMKRTQKSKFSCVYCFKGPTSITRALLSWPNLILVLSKTLLFPNILHWGLGLQHVSFGAETFSLQNCLLLPLW